MGDKEGGGEVPTGPKTILNLEEKHWSHGTNIVEVIDVR